MQYLYLCPQLMEELQVVIRKGNCADDFAYAYRCAKELAMMEQLHHFPSMSMEDFIEDGLRAQPPFELLVAKADQDYAGAAVYYYGYSTWRGRIIYLCDLVVEKTFRRKGIARKLLNEIVKVAKHDDVKLLWWHVLKNNNAAINLYETFGVNIDDCAFSCKLENSNFKIA